MVLCSGDEDQTIEFLLEIEKNIPILINCLVNSKPEIFSNSIKSKKKPFGMGRIKILEFFITYINLKIPSKIEEIFSDNKFFTILLVHFMNFPIININYN